MRKITVILLTFLLSITLAPNILPAQLPKTVYVKAYAVNIRSGPGLEFDKVAVVFLNTPLEAIDRDSAWYQVIVGDTMSGWIARRYTGDSQITGLEQDKIYYLEGGLEVKLETVKRMVKQRGGPQFEFLKSVIVNHEEFQLSVEYDIIILEEIFKGWMNNSVQDAVSVLLYVMENDLSGEIGKSPEMMRELRLSAKEAIKKLVRE